MILRVILLWSILSYAKAEMKSHQPLREGECLTGHMTDVQSWVTAEGKLNTEYVDQNSSVDLSGRRRPEALLQERLRIMSESNNAVKFLSMAECELTRIPLVFQLTNRKGRSMSLTLEYMTFYGNKFEAISSPGQAYDVFFNATGATEAAVTHPLINQESTIIWSSGLEQAQFPKLKELDLRACQIRIITAGVFRGMTSLEALYIGENEIFRLDMAAFAVLKKLHHLDISRNNPKDEDGMPSTLVAESVYTFENLTNLVSMDLSHTKLTPRSGNLLKGLGKSLKSLSVCNTGLFSVTEGVFANTSLEILDISGNSATGVLDTLRGLENSLKILYAKEAGFQNINAFHDFRKLEVLQLANNEIFTINQTVAKTLTSLKILDLNKNRMLSWFDYNMFSLMPNLKLLSLRTNNINIITEPMIKDIMYIDYVAFTDNSFVCNCHARDFFNLALKNEKKFENTLIKSSNSNLYHVGFKNYNSIIKYRQPLEYDCDEDCQKINVTGRFRLLDEFQDSYKCTNMSSYPGRRNRSIMMSSVASCIANTKTSNYEHELASGRNTLLVLIVIPCLLVPMLFMFWFRRNVMYFFIMMRNSALLSMINRREVIEDNTIFNYDVFVSYCNEDRGWVLDHLLPHLESDCSVSACLHERDFQVGLTILENIVSCLDRSRMIMLILSQRFLRSQWCQFEMHLAQHRLLETRREDLILVLLEDIPRRLRPNTLHYLMLTKTYIVWPKAKSDRSLFWKRMKKSLLSQKIKQKENVSLA